MAAISPHEIDEVVAQFAAGARMLAAAGFDCVELHFGHLYLVSAFLSPRWNRRADDYGGTTENRARLARRILRAAARCCGITRSKRPISCPWPGSSGQGYRCR